ncbi:MAG: GTP-binding protein [Burkholderiales bacterium]|nr:GTP-binding protein [Burkholderiales bacterium]
MSERVPDSRLPVCVITGFLGSGKTTFLNRLLADPALARSLVVINEFGEMGLDHLLVTAPVENMLLLENGCLCCSNRGDLVETLTDAHEKWRSGRVPPFDRVIVETSGLADPVSIMQTVVADENLAPRFVLDRIITLVDGVNGGGQLESFPEAVKQAVIADQLILSKTDLATADVIDSLRERLRGINSGAEIIAAVHGQTGAERLFAHGETRRGLREVRRWLGNDAIAGHGVSARRREAADHSAGVNTFSLRHEQPVSWTGLQLWMDLLSRFKGMDLLRIKGILNVEGRPVVIHAVQSIVHEPVTLEAWPDEDRASRMVFIVRNIGRADIEKTLEALSYEVAPATVSGIDPEAYASFARQAGRFHS